MFSIWFQITLNNFLAQEGRRSLCNVFSHWLRLRLVWSKTENWARCKLYWQQLSSSWNFNFAWNLICQCMDEMRVCMCLCVCVKFRVPVEIPANTCCPYIEKRVFHTRINFQELLDLGTCDLLKGPFGVLSVAVVGVSVAEPTEILNPHYLNCIRHL